MNNKRSGLRTHSRNWANIIGGTALWLFAGVAHAGMIDIGALSYDTFLPAGGGSPGVFAFNLANLTGGYDLPPDFPVTDNLTFGSATLTLTLSDLSQDVITLGDVGPGFLLDGSGNPIVQVPGDTLFDSAEFKATLSPLTFALSDGTQFTANSSSIDVTLLPSIGTNLTVDVDQTSISVTGTVTSSTPEPASGALVLTSLMGLAWHRRRNPGSEPATTKPFAERKAQPTED